ncbi:MAG: hypothetical protein ACOVQ8_05420 [Elstera sp.]
MVAIIPITYQPVAPARPVRRRQPEAEEQQDEKRTEEATAGANAARPRFDLDDEGDDLADPRQRRRSKSLALVSAQVTFQAQQFAQEHLGNGLYYEPWGTATAAYKRWEGA